MNMKNLKKKLKIKLFKIINDSETVTIDNSILRSDKVTYDWINDLYEFIREIDLDNIEYDFAPQNPFNENKQPSNQQEYPENDEDDEDSSLEEEGNNLMEIETEPIIEEEDENSEGKEEIEELINRINNNNIGQMSIHNFFKKK